MLAFCDLTIIRALYFMLSGFTTMNSNVKEQRGTMADTSNVRRGSVQQMFHYAEITK